MPDSSIPAYDEDFFAWTQAQADALRQLAPSVIGNRVDVAHIAEEIEDLGRRDLREVASYLVRLFEHLLKLVFHPTSIDRILWRDEARNFQARASEAYAPSMRRLIEPEKLWRRGRKAALSFLVDIGQRATITTTCPFEIEAVVSADFDLDVALAKIDGAAGL